MKYVCPAHTDIPVTWRGTGCSQCATETQRRSQRRLERHEPTELPDWITNESRPR